jgi:hypothetical protein
MSGGGNSQDHLHLPPIDIRGSRLNSHGMEQMESEGTDEASASALEIDLQEMLTLSKK